ncbi:MAG: TonB-dependent receptor [Sulfuricurvum sp.]|uniref:TonB-dependent receptor domain-containing protein n=1 Tax=Sulfuricurvum sp. TaxID=2025608 RepID=UPI00263245DB|nr:TonB-dependent receptor [Sulfuricurvum sp.]MDD2828761.1 TonB-dependent receptor [Sulfuricurvum sp.]MDD4949339.1 TonB-dependent receptor [Sulfuricurvum sp.]
MFKHTLSLVASATLVASLGANTLQLEPIVVSASKSEQPLKEITANIDVITADELEERHITSVIDALKTLSNIPIAQNGGIGETSSFFLRGFSSENAVVLVDGIRYNDPTTPKGQSQLEHLMVNDVERIEILKGAQSGVWGANAVAGVINIITKKATEKLSIATSTEYGSYATTKLGANISQKIGNLSYYFGASQIKTNGFSSNVPKGKNPEDYEGDGYKNETVNSKISYDVTSSDTLHAQANFIDALSQYDAYAQPNSEANEIHQINRLGSLSYEHRFNQEDSLSATYSISSFDKKDPLGYTKAFIGTNKEGSIQGNYHYMPNAFLVIGGNVLHTKDTVSANELNSKGVFLTNTNRLDNLVLTESIRHDSYDTFADKTTGKIGAKYNFTEEIALSSNYGTAYRTPSLFELYASFYGNPNLQPETTKSFDITGSYKHLSATYYNNLVDNLIGSNPSTYVYEQVSGKSRLKGYELSYKNTITSDLVLDLGYNRLWAKNQNNQELQRRSKDTLRSTLDYYGISKLHIGFNAHYIGTRYDDIAQTKQTGRYTLWGAVVNYDATESLSFYLKGDNLSDKLYQEVDGYGTAGRTLYVGANAKF